MSGEVIRGGYATEKELVASLKGPPPGHPNRQAVPEVPLYKRLKEKSADVQTTSPLDEMND